MVTAGAGTPTGTGGSTPAGTAPVPAEFLAGFPETLAEVSRSCRALTRAERESRRALGEQAA
ncbi:hypothetical protein ITX34_25775, partial [Streptomyces bryophytorum]|nr:hypothetical protein [Actinacidiphila bryophytorum]